jgi:hypothetical protein
MCMANLAVAIGLGLSHFLAGCSPAASASAFPAGAMLANFNRAV